MPQIDGFWGVMGSRSFGTLWYWLALITVWTWAGRSVLGVPWDVVSNARRALSQSPQPGTPRQVTLLLDWLSLTLPRWRPGGAEGPLLTALAAFVLAALVVLGWVYGQEMAQAVALIAVPFAGVYGLRLRLARHLTPLMADVMAGRMVPGQAAGRMLAKMRWHRVWVTVISVLAVSISALWGTIWQITHPFGL